MKKTFEKNFIASKDPPSNFRAGGGVILTSDFISSGSPKNTFLSFKRQKWDATVNLLNENSIAKLFQVNSDFINKFFTGNDFQTEIDSLAG